MTIRKNIVANYIGVGTTALVPVLVLPLYLSLLGAKQFGLISFVVMLQTFFALLDGAVSQALIGEFAHRFNKSNSNLQATAALLFGFERIYWLFSLCASLLMILLANAITKFWLNIGELPVVIAEHAIYGAAIIFLFQFPGSVYRSLFIGMQDQVLLNKITIFGVFLRHIVGLIFIMVWPTIYTYLVWQTVSALAETFVRATFAWKLLRVDRKKTVFDMNELKPFFKEVTKMVGAIVLGSLTVQMDKLVLIRMVSIEQFGYYAIANSLTFGMLQLLNPVTQAVLPRAVELKNDPKKLREFYFKLLYFIGFLVFFCALSFMFFGKWLMGLWLKNSYALDVIYPLVSIMLVGVGLNAFYNVGYINWIVFKKSNRIVKVNLISLVLSFPLMLFLVSKIGIKGAAVGWLIINLTGLLISLEWIKEKK